MSHRSQTKDGIKTADELLNRPFCSIKNEICERGNDSAEGREAVDHSCYSIPWTGYCYQDEKMVHSGDVSSLQVAKLPFLINDGKWHHLCITWTTRDGMWEAFQDGVKRGSGENLAPYHPIKPDGVLVLGQEQVNTLKNKKNHLLKSLHPNRSQTAFGKTLN